MPNGQQKTEREKEIQKKQMRNRRGFTMGDCPLLTSMFAKRTNDGEITLQWLRSITTHTHTKNSPSLPTYSHGFMWSFTI